MIDLYACFILCGNLIIIVKRNDNFMNYLKQFIYSMYMYDDPVINGIDNLSRTK